MKITNTLGRVYEIVDMCPINDYMKQKKSDCIVYRVARAKGEMAVGYVGYAKCGGVSLYGPLAVRATDAYRLAWMCAYNRSNAMDKMHQRF